MKTPPADPVLLFKDWLSQAEKTEVNDPTAACLATSDQTGMPNARMVLIRQINEQGFVFFTNYNSCKGHELFSNPRAALCFHWKTQRRQIRIQGDVEKTMLEEADAYYESRARESRIGAWASLQSSLLADRDLLLKRYAEYETQYSEIENPPRPPHWSGFRIVPKKIEFWKEGNHRLHERLVFEKNGSDWKTYKLYP